MAARLGTAFGTVLAKGARVVASRDAHPASRMIKRAMLSGLVASGSAVSDLRVALPAVNRHEMKVDERAHGIHVSVSGADADVINVQFFEPPGILVSDQTLKGVERCYSRQEFRRVGAAEIGAADLSHPCHRGLHLASSWTRSIPTRSRPGAFGSHSTTTTLPRRW